MYDGEQRWMCKCVSFLLWGSDIQSIVVVEASSTTTMDWTSLRSSVNSRAFHCAKNEPHNHQQAAAGGKNLNEQSSN